MIRKSGETMMNFHIENNLDGIFDIVPIPMLLVTKNDFQVVRLNPAAAKFLDITEAAVTARQLTDFLDTKHKDYIAWMRCIKDNGTTVPEFPLRLKDHQTMVTVYTAYINFAGVPHLLLSLVNMPGTYSQIKQLEQLAAKDDMTGLLNRRAFRERLESTLLNLREEKSDFFLAFMDLDELKKVNDSYGHREGDCYINMFTALLRRALRKTDIAGRIGGDEFAVIFTQCSRHYAEQAIWCLQQQLKTVSSSLKKKYTMSVSSGLIVIKSCLETDVDTLLNIADEALYSQKYRHCRPQDTGLTKNRRDR